MQGSPRLIARGEPCSSALRRGICGHPGALRRGIDRHLRQQRYGKCGRVRCRNNNRRHRLLPSCSCPQQFGTAIHVLHRRRRGRGNQQGTYRSLALFGQAGDEVGRARAIGNLATVFWLLGHHGPAAEHYQQALALYRRTGDRTGEANSLTNLGKVEFPGDQAPGL